MSEHLPAKTAPQPRRIAAVQSSYVPWKGYFDLIHSVDEFVLFDDVQYTRRDWRNRNRIKTREGLTWLTIPVAAKGKYLEPIKSIMVSDPGWRERHWRLIRSSYARSPGFAEYEELFRRLYLDSDEQRLSAINAAFIRDVCRILGITTKITWSMDYTLESGRNERLISLCRQTGATTYLSGPRARAYLDIEMFKASGIEVSFFDYTGYPEYPQPFPPFDHHVSIIDLLFSVGSRAPQFMLSF